MIKIYIKLILFLKNMDYLFILEKKIFYKSEFTLESKKERWNDRTLTYEIF